MLVTEATKTNEVWSLPLRSSQSIEHRQQMKYWLCLLGSISFYSETPFYLRLFTPIYLDERTSYGKTGLRGAQNGQGTANHPPCPGGLLMPRLNHGQEGGRDGPSELWESGRNYSEAPSGTHLKSQNKIPDTAFHQALLAQTAKTAARSLDRTASQSRARWG